MTPLRDYLLDVYGGYADRRIKDRSMDRDIKIDDKGPHDVYPFFCNIFARVPDRNDDRLVLTLQNCPCSPEVMSIVERQGGTIRPSEHGPTITFAIHNNHVFTIARLSLAIANLVKSRRKYTNRNWKWICTRTAGSLDRLVKILEVYQGGRRPVDS